MSYSRLWIAAVVPLATALFASPVVAAEPQVAFAVQDGWVGVTVTQDDRPVVAAQVQVYAADGRRFADGETGAGGRSDFPLPPGPDFRVEIRVGDRWADPIRLTPVGDHVVPTNVLLSFGLAPCCRVPSRSWPSDPPADPASDPPELIVRWALAGGGVLFALLGVTTLVLGRRRPSVPTHNHPSEQPR